MKIALVSPYDQAYPGGVGEHISHLQDEFMKVGHQVAILAPCSKRHPAQGVNVIPFGRPVPIPSGGAVARIGVSLRLYRQVRRVLEVEKFDVIHLHEPLVPLLPLMVLRYSQAVNVGTFHAAHGRHQAYHYGRRLLNRWFRKLDGKIAVSLPASRFVSQYFPGYYNIIPNGVDVSEYGEEGPVFGALRDGKVNILFVSRLEKRKGLTHLLRAFAMLRQTHPNTRLIVVGEGRGRGGYEQEVRKRALTDVVFTGYVSEEDKRCYYRTADIFCAPATGNESFGVILLEAMASAKPVVASRNEGYASVLREGEEGFLVPPADPESLQESLAQLVDSPELRRAMGKRGRQRAQEFAWESVAGRVLNYYHRLLSERSAVLSDGAGRADAV